MHPLYQSALKGTLVSYMASAEVGPLTFVNKLPIPVWVAWLGSDGRIQARFPLKPTESHTFSSSSPGYAYVVLTMDSGAFVCAYKHDLASGSSVLIDEKMLCKPNELGDRPEPTKLCPIPRDTQPILVGVGTIVNSNPLTSISRQQYWRLAPDSYVLAPGEKRSVGFEETSGMQSTTSTEDSLSTSLGLGLNVGWGPISASMSASITSTSTTMQQVVLTNETTRHESVELNNTSPDPVMYLYWQMMEIVTVFHALKPVATTTSGLRPVLVSKAYDPNKLPAVPSLPFANDLPLPSNPVLRIGSAAAGKRRVVKPAKKKR